MKNEMHKIEATTFLNLGERLQALYEKRFKCLKSNIIFEGSVWDIESSHKDELGAFHATGVCMIEKPDDYLCGIRADHFVVEEGWSEYHSGVIYLISANHKGNRAQTMIEMKI